LGGLLDFFVRVSGHWSPHPRNLWNLGRRACAWMTTGSFPSMSSTPIPSSAPTAMPGQVQLMIECRFDAIGHQRSMGFTDTRLLVGLAIVGTTSRPNCENIDHPLCIPAVEDDPPLTHAQPPSRLGPRSNLTSPSGSAPIATLIRSRSGDRGGAETSRRRGGSRSAIRPDQPAFNSVTASDQGMPGSSCASRTARRSSSVSASSSYGAASSLATTGFWARRSRIAAAGNDSSGRASTNQLI